MDILIISQFGSTYSENDNDRFLYIAKKMCINNRVEIVTSSFCHEKKNYRVTAQKEWPFKITFLNEIGYKKNVCIKRFLSHFIWGINLKKYLKQRKTPDVVYCAVPSLTGPYFVAKYCKKNKVKFVIDIQDLWPEAFKMVFHVPILSDLMFFPFTYLANYIYKNADEIVAVSKTYVDRALRVNKKCSVAYPVFLGTDLEVFDNNVKHGNVEKDKKEIWIGYCGTLGSSYDLTCVFDALKKVKEKKGKAPKFIIMGDGPLLSQFKKYAANLDVDTVFMGRMPYDEMCSYISACDIAVNPIMAGAAQSIINKHADYVASGIPIISTQESEEFRRLIDKYKMGMNCTNGNVDELANAIMHLMDNFQERIIMGVNARRCAEEQFDRKQSYKKIVNIILN